jgi:hypothetical protein
MKTPILLLLFNRPNHTSKLIKSLEKIKPRKVYINIDGPRSNNLNDKYLCKKVYELVKKINWKCKVNIRKFDFNNGCRKSVKNAIDYFFSKEKYGIILEDDCIPCVNFFDFCTKILKKYYNINKVKSISGNNFQKNKDQYIYDYYFSKYMHCWGWATWRRAWKEYDDELLKWKKITNSNYWKKLHPNILESKYWKAKIDLVQKKKIDSWAYVWLASIWINKGIVVNPSINLVNNIGFDGSGLHTFVNRFYFNNFDKIKNFDFIKHPKNLNLNETFDQKTFEIHYNGIFNFWPYRAIYIFFILIKNPLKVYKKIIQKLKFINFK